MRGKKHKQTEEVGLDSLPAVGPGAERAKMSKEEVFDLGESAGQDGAETGADVTAENNKQDTNPDL